jgi:DNA-binding HxlR family transcriptional regulator
MKSIDMSVQACPVARSLDRVGEGWSILILRDAMYGLTRFDEFEKSLGIAPNILAKRLSELVEAGMLERVQYCNKPLRYEYLLTELGWSFRAVMLAFVEWGSSCLAPEGRAVQLTERTSGRPVRIGMVDLDTGRPVTNCDFVMTPGPAADEAIRYRFAYIENKRTGQASNLKFMHRVRTVVTRD